MAFPDSSSALDKFQSATEKQPGFSLPHYCDPSIPTDFFGPRIAHAQGLPAPRPKKLKQSREEESRCEQFNSSFHSSPKGM